jgi:hypothetical protein
VTPQLARKRARQLYGNHPAALALLLKAAHGPSEERRKRCAAALAMLDPDNDVDRLQLAALVAGTPRGHVTPVRPQRQKAA